MKYLDLSIYTDDTEETYNKITRLLGVEPKPVDLESKFNKRPNSKPYGVWRYQVIEKDEGPYFDFINVFLDILDPHYSSLEKLGIERDDIIFWYLYEYDQQCNMEFHPSKMKRLGESGIALCISCWQQ